MAILDFFQYLIIKALITSSKPAFPVQLRSATRFSASPYSINASCGYGQWSQPGCVQRSAGFKWVLINPCKILLNVKFFRGGIKGLLEQPSGSLLIGWTVKELLKLLSQLRAAEGK